MAIIGVLVSMLLPAVNAARASARKTYCAVRLRELAIATAGYESANKRIPPNLTPKIRQWQFHLLPHLEQSAIHSVITNENEDAYAWLTFSSFLCPEDPDSEFPMRQYASFLLVGKSDFAGVAGTTEDLADGVFPPYGKGLGGLNFKGMRYSEIVDGLSNTLLYGERPPARNGTVGSWLRGFTYLNATSGVLERGPFSMGQGDEPMQACGPQGFKMGDPINPCSATHFWSFHVGGAHFVTVDGAVSFRPYSIDERVLAAMATRNGGEVNIDPQ
jgi:hypothetical protein